MEGDEGWGWGWGRSVWKRVNAASRGGGGGGGF